MTTVVELKDPESDYVAKLEFSEPNNAMFPLNCNLQWLNPPPGKFLYGTTHSPLDIDHEVQEKIDTIFQGYTEIARYEQ